MPLAKNHSRTLLGESKGLFSSFCDAGQTPNELGEPGIREAEQQGGQNRVGIGRPTWSRLAGACHDGWRLGGGSGVPPASRRGSQSLISPSSSLGSLYSGNSPPRFPSALRLTFSPGTLGFLRSPQRSLSVFFLVNPPSRSSFFSLSSLFSLFKPVAQQ